MKFRISAIAMFLICAAIGYAQASETSKPTFVEEYFFRHAYNSKPNHKAMAIGRNGAFSVNWGNGNSKDAKLAAIANCRNNYAKQRLNGVADGNCRLVAVDGKQLYEGATTLPDWQMPLAGEDKPLAQGFRAVLPTKNSRGILLAVHGCDGMGHPTYNAAWGSFYNSLGLDYYVPNSFAETRPRPVCGNHVENGVELVSEVFRLRIAQTLRTIEKLHAANPGKPIYLWGHSEGSLIVQAIEADVAGIIVSGDECGVLNLPVGAAANIPFLYVLGADDKNVEGMRYPFSEKSMGICKKFMGKRKWSAVVIPRNGHIIHPWRAKGAAAIAKFVGGVYRTIDPLPATRKITLTKEAQTAFEAYRKMQNHRAFAADPSGDFNWAAGWDYAEDVTQLTLFNCAKNNGYDIFALGYQHCALINVDGKTQQK
jgi:hypothetical protein